MTPRDRPTESPRSSQSPVPSGLQGDLEMELFGLANSLYNLGVTVVNDASKDKNKTEASGGKPVGQRVNDVIGHLATIEAMAANVKTMIPMQVIQEVDNSRNPMQLTKDRLERAATENQFMNGKIHAISSYCNMLDEALLEHFPEIGPFLPGSSGIDMKVSSGPNGLEHRDQA